MKDIKNKNILNALLIAMKKCNDSQEKPISEDQTNEELLLLFENTGLELCDSEDSLIKAFGEDGYWIVREAEQGDYSSFEQVNGE